MNQMMRISVVRVLLTIGVVHAAGCAALQVAPDAAVDMRNVNEVAFLGAYDARMMSGGVDTERAVTTYHSRPIYGSQGYAGSIMTPQTDMVKTGEIGANQMLDLVAEGFRSGVTDASRIRDLSGSTALEARSEMGMDWLAKKDATLPRYLVAIEIKSATVEDLDGVRSNAALGWSSVFIGCLFPPCWLYPLFAQTTANGHAGGTMRVYDRQTGNVIARDTLSVDVPLSAEGFHSEDDVYKMLSVEAGRRLGTAAARRLAVVLATPPPQMPAPPAVLPSEPVGAPPPPPTTVPTSLDPAATSY
jgi:hypothetical protein